MPRHIAVLALSMGLLVPVLAECQAESRATVPPKTGHAIAPLPSPVRAPGAVRVLLLRSWGVTTGWEDLKTQWQNYGSIPIAIDDSTYIQSDFTYDDLVASGANVIVLSDPAGGLQQYTPAEVLAVSQYASTGHTVLGTYAVFEWDQTDNRGLMSVFGLKRGVMNTQSISNSFTQVKNAGCLFRNLASTWQSSGYAQSQVPSPSLQWGQKALGSATLVAQSDNATGIVSVYGGPGYTSVYISNYPEFYGATNDLQLLYNAVTCFNRTSE